MELFGQRYIVNFRNGRQKRITAQQILRFVRRDSKSDYDWFASSEELVRICNLPEFPQDVAILIEAVILNCYANIENSAQRYPEENPNVTFCYNSLIENEEYDKLREKYIRSILDGVIRFGMTNDLKIRHMGKTYIKMCSEWKSKTSNHFVSGKSMIVDLRELRQSFNDDFDNVVHDAEVRGLFSDEKEIISWMRILQNYDYEPDPEQIR